MAAAAQLRPQPAPAESDIVVKAHAAFRAIAEAMRRMAAEASILAAKSDALLWAAAAARWQAEALGHQLELVAIEADNQITGGKGNAKATLIIRQAGPLLSLWRGWCGEALTAPPDRVREMPRELAVGLRLIANIYKHSRLQMQLSRMEAERARLEKALSEAKATLERLRATAAKIAGHEKETAEHEATIRAAERSIAEARVRQLRAEASTARIVEEDRKFKKRLKKARHKGRRWALDFDNHTLLDADRDQLREVETGVT